MREVQQSEKSCWSGLNQFCVSYKNRRKYNQHFKHFIFQNQFILRHIKLNIYVQKTKFTSYNQHLFGLLLSKHSKNTHSFQGILQAFLLSLKRKVSQTFTEECSTFFFMKGIFKTRKLSECMFAMRSCNQFFMSRYMFLKIVSNK